ncbi:ATP-dependent DNA ligase LigD phosphoesterase module /ATP-dependent DNA ligase LigD polymerase module [Delftia acidovorans]|uniref:DNA ligase D n=1 Tax=Delftia acidovorans TaxID=80866 RepID=UPI000F4CBF34|nr:DNA ligase D [Delftia acidovorans]ROQ93007.1 ATP-dependent DNA ligase LigD phosphoesterase module /ATP-dependent DNA ligase LigD polymerase module [Delftia acidovorans]
MPATRSKSQASRQARPTKGAAKAATPQASLALYRQKRDFTRTPEPSAEPSSETIAGQPGAGALQFVIQKHWASHLHYDFRLELDGSMKSWAVPKGPSYDPADKRMAVQVEDHPMAYNRFEGQIPPGQYGAGKVIIWDRGTWLPEGDAAEGYRKGKLKFELRGHKLQGRWALVRMRGKDDAKKPAWLLIKEHDGLERAASEFNVVEDMPDSVAGLPLPTATAPITTPVTTPVATHVAALMPQSIAPQLATLVDHAPADAGQWIFESKFDGYRLLARIEDGAVRLFTRNGKDWTTKMPALARAFAALPLQSGWVDGEVLMLDSDSRPDFQALQNAFDGERTDHLVFFAFDLLWQDGQDLRPQPVEQRRQQLRALLHKAPSDRLRFSEAFDAPPADLVAAACQLGLEGVIGKRRGSAYASRRSADWIKLKCGLRQEFVIAGYTDPQGTRTGLGALVLAVHGEDGQLRAAGKVGTGFNRRTLADLRQRLERLATGTSPLADSRGLGSGVHWVRPTLLAEVSFAQWTEDGQVRHAVFQGLRADKPARSIVKEEPQHVPSTASSASAAATPGAARPETRNARAARLPASMTITHPERVIDPSTGITKMDLARYYATVAPFMITHLKSRPVAMVRAPDGIEGELFFQKHLDQAPLQGIAALSPELDPGHAPLMEVSRREGLVAAAQMNTIEWHTWNARKDRIDRPDRMTFDLDPGEGVPWQQVQEAASLLHVLLQELELPAFLKTSGGKGLHVVVPIKRLLDWDTVKAFSQAVVQHLAHAVPQRFVAKSGPRNRVGKIFVDYLRNGFGATTACAWTARARPGMGISVPVAWNELDRLTGGAHWTIRSVDQRLRLGNSPWEHYGTAAVGLGRAMKALGFESQR